MKVKFLSNVPFALSVREQRVYKKGEVADIVDKTALSLIEQGKLEKVVSRGRPAKEADNA